MKFSKLLFAFSFFATTTAFSQIPPPLEWGEAKLNDSGYCYYFDHFRGFKSGAYPCGGDHTTDVVTCGVELRDTFFAKRGLEAISRESYWTGLNERKLEHEQIISVGNCERLFYLMEETNAVSCANVRRNLDEFKRTSDLNKEYDHYIPLFYDNDDGTFNKEKFDADWADNIARWDQEDCDPALVADYYSFYTGPGSDSPDRSVNGNKCRESKQELQELNEQIASRSDRIEASQKNSSDADLAFSNCLETNGISDSDVNTSPNGDSEKNER